MTRRFRRLCSVMPRESGASSTPGLRDLTVRLIAEGGVYWIARLREGFAELSIDDSLGEQIR